MHPTQRLSIPRGRAGDQPADLAPAPHPQRHVPGHPPCGAADRLRVERHLSALVFTSMAKSMAVHGWAVLTSMLMRATCRLQRCASIGGSASATSTTSSITGSVTSGSKRCCRWTHDAATLSVRAGNVPAPGGLWRGVGLSAAGRPAPCPPGRHGHRRHRPQTPAEGRRSDDASARSLGTAETFREAVAQLDAYLQFRPEHVDRRQINAQLHVLTQAQESRHEMHDPGGDHDREGQTETREIACLEREDLTPTTLGPHPCRRQSHPQSPARGRGGAANDGVSEDATSLCTLRPPAAQ